MDKVIDFINYLPDLDFEDILHFAQAAKKPGTEVVYLKLNDYDVCVAVIVEGTPHDEAIKEIVNEIQPDDVKRILNMDTD